MGAVVYQRIGQSLQFADVFQYDEENEYHYERVGRTSIGRSGGVSNINGGLRGARGSRDYIPEAATSILLCGHAYVQYLLLPEFTKAKNCGRRTEDLENSLKPDSYARGHNRFAGRETSSPSDPFQSQSQWLLTGKQESTAQKEVGETPSHFPDMLTQPDTRKLNPEPRKQLTVTDRFFHSLPPPCTINLEKSSRNPSEASSVEPGTFPTLDLKEDAGWATKESRCSKSHPVLTDDNASNATIATNTIEASGLLSFSRSSTDRSGFRSHASNQIQEGSTTGSGETATPKESGNENRKHQCSGSDEEDDAEPDEKPNHPRKRSARSPADDLNEKRLRCPFNAFDLERYSEKNLSEKLYRGCSTALLTSIPRLKQHLYRVHKKPENYCLRCFEVYESEEQLEEHMHQTTSCSVTEVKFGDKMSAAQFTKIKRRENGKTTEEKWFSIFRILFPGSTPPASPYVEDTPNTNNLVEEVFDFFRDRMPSVMTEALGGLGYFNESTTYIAAHGVIPGAIETVIQEYNLLQTTGRKPKQTRVDIRSIRQNTVAGSSLRPERRETRIIKAQRVRTSTKGGKESRRSAMPTTESPSLVDVSSHQQSFGYEDQSSTTMFETYQDPRAPSAPNPSQYSSSSMANMPYYQQANDMRQAGPTEDYATSSFTQIEPANSVIDNNQNPYIQHAPPASNQVSTHHFDSNFDFSYTTAVDPAKTERPTGRVEADVWPDPFVDVDSNGNFI